MHRLRRDTLELADERLPEVMRKVEAGEAVDTTTEGSQLDFGTDELGQVAAAFNRAHVAAMSAAVAEAQTKAGISTVFLDIAHRSQVVVHRQLSLLDRAERDENNADQLDLLFQLDHLATRARRNAENLIILGGEQPGRRWRNPVPLIDLVRGAIAESLDYTRIAAKQMPQVKISGHAVADVIHLLAELMDNATAFSPPESQVSVSGSWSVAVSRWRSSIRVSACRKPIWRNATRCWPIRPPSVSARWPALHGWACSSSPRWRADTASRCGCRNRCTAACEWWC